jgi:hypothetical protein
MNIRRNGSGHVAALSAALACLAFTPALSAQEPTPEEEEPAPAAPPAADAPKETEAKPEAPKEEAPKPEPAKAEATATAAAEVKPAPAAAPPASDPERDKAVGLVGVERLPGSAYPTPRTRGITGGSLWLTMHGLQWPYMPAAAGKPALRLGFSGSVWSDGSYARTISGLETYENQKRMAVQSRAVLRMTPTYSTPAGWFGQGQAEFVAQGDNLVPNNNVTGYTDDLWVRIGKWNSFDLTVGRMQGFEIANHYGMGLDLNTFEREGASLEKQGDKPPGAYGLTYFWDRREGNIGNYAVHLYPAGWFKLPADMVRLELLGQFGAGTNDGQAIQTNFRPSGIVDLGIVKVKGGFEYGKSISQLDGKPENVTRNGYGFALQLVLDPYIEGGAGFAQGWEDIVNGQNVYDVAASNMVTGVSGFLNARVYRSLIVGGGALNSYKKFEDIDENMSSVHYGENNFDNQFQVFGAIQYSFWDTFFIKFVTSYAYWRHQDRSATTFANKQLSGRLRLMILF